MSKSIPSANGYRVAILNLTGGGLSGGYRKYLRRLVPLLEGHPDIRALKVFLPQQMADAFPVGDGVYEIFPAPVGAFGSGGALGRALAGRYDVIFVPTARWVHCGPTPVVTMVRNMEPLTRPFDGNQTKEGIKNLLRYLAAWKCARRARRVIAVSRYVRDFLERKWRLDRRKIGLVYHGSDPSTGAVVSQPLAVHRPRIFTAGSIRRARGLEDLVEAAGLLKRDGLEFEITIAGVLDDQRYRDYCDRRARELGIDSQFSWIGRLSESEMLRHFRECDLFVMTSRTEACPNISLEAMAQGCLCVSTDSPPMPEFFGNSALYYQAGSGESLADALRKARQLSPESARHYRQEARSTAGHFTWEECARRTVAELRLAIEMN